MDAEKYFLTVAKTCQKHKKHCKTCPLLDLDCGDPITYGAKPDLETIRRLIQTVEALAALEEEGGENACTA